MNQQSKKLAKEVSKSVPFAKDEIEQVIDRLELLTGNAVTKKQLNAIYTSALQCAVSPMDVIDIISRFNEC